MVHIAFPSSLAENGRNKIDGPRAGDDEKVQERGQVCKQESRMAECPSERVRDIVQT